MQRCSHYVLWICLHVWRMLLALLITAATQQIHVDAVSDASCAGPSTPLRSLDVFNNSLSGNASAAFCNMPSLTDLELAANKFSGAGRPFQARAVFFYLAFDSFHCTGKLAVFHIAMFCEHLTASISSQDRCRRAWRMRPRFAHCQLQATTSAAASRSRTLPACRSCRT